MPYVIRGMLWGLRNWKEWRIWNKSKAFRSVWDNIFLVVCGISFPHTMLFQTLKSVMSWANLPLALAQLISSLQFKQVVTVWREACRTQGLLCAISRANLGSALSWPCSLWVLQSWWEVSTQMTHFPGEIPFNLTRSALFLGTRSWT